MKTKFNYTKEELLDVMKRQYVKNPQSTNKDFREYNGLPHYAVYVREFGSFAEAKILCGVSKTKSRKRNISKDDLKLDLLNLKTQLNHVPSQSEYDKYSSFNRHNIKVVFEDYESLLRYCNLESTTLKNGKIKDDFLLSEIKRFVIEFGRIPIQKDLENLEGYPSRKTFTNHFGSFNDVIRLAGFEPNDLSIKEKQDFFNRDDIKEDMIDYLKQLSIELGHTPTVKDLDNNVKYNRSNYRNVFGSHNKAIEKAGLEINQISQYDDEFLHSEFERFVKEKDRPPYLQEFNASEYPSFWCYQNRFGSWNKTLIAYGYEPSDSNRKYYMDDGEVCASSYEFDISKWLHENNIVYDRNIKYIDIDSQYKGKMDCDYKINYNNKVWYVEMAGFLPRYNVPFKKFSAEEKNYFFKLKYKIKLLERNEINYLIIKPHHMKNKTLEEIFEPIFK